MRKGLGRVKNRRLIKCNISGANDLADVWNSYVKDAGGGVFSFSFSFPPINP